MSASFRQKIRELTLQMLVVWEFFPGADAQDTQAFLASVAGVSPEVLPEVMASCHQVQVNQEKIDKALQRHTEGQYAWERIPAVERAVLRLGAYELCHADSKVPPKVALAEAIRLARKFSTRESARFVNAVLDAIYQEMLLPSSCTAAPCHGNSN